FVFVYVFFRDRPERGAYVLGETNHRRLMTREKPIRLDVEHELRWRARYPGTCVVFGRDAVVAAVDLDDGKLRRVIAQPRLRRGRVRRIEAAAFDQRLVGTRRGAEQDFGFGHDSPATIMMQDGQADVAMRRSVIDLI